MSQPIRVDLPHSLGLAEARRRIAGGIGRLEDHIPGGASRVEHRWEGNRLDLQVAAMGQQVNARIDVGEKVVTLEVVLPPALAFFGRAIEGLIRRQGGELLEDKRSKG